MLRITVPELLPAPRRQSFGSEVESEEREEHKSGEEEEETSESEEERRADSEADAASAVPYSTVSLTLCRPRRSLDMSLTSGSIKDHLFTEPK